MADNSHLPLSPRWPTTIQIALKTIMSISALSPINFDPQMTPCVRWQSSSDQTINDIHQPNKSFSSCKQSLRIGEVKIFLLVWVILNRRQDALWLPILFNFLFQVPILTLKPSTDWEWGYLKDASPFMTHKHSCSHFQQISYWSFTWTFLGERQNISEWRSLIYKQSLLQSRIK